MEYLEFLASWFNLPYVVAVAVGVVMAFRRRRNGKGTRRLAAAVFVAGITGLTLNGAIHDLGLGSPASRFPLVLVVAALMGIGLSFAAFRVLRRLFPPVTGVTWNEPGLEGSIAQIVTSTAGPQSPGGRARVRDAEGIVHVVRVHASGGPLRFGRRVRLGSFDDTRQAYPVEPV